MNNLISSVKKFPFFYLHFCTSVHLKVTAFFFFSFTSLGWILPLLIEKDFETLTIRSLMRNFSVTLIIFISLLICCFPFLLTGLFPSQAY